MFVCALVCECVCVRVRVCVCVCVRVCVCVHVRVRVCKCVKWKVEFLLITVVCECTSVQACLKGVGIGSPRPIGAVLN
jgi:hypothetical protein